MGLGVTGLGLFIAALYLIVGCFIDAIPAIIIVGTVLFPVAQAVGMNPIHYALISVISLAFGLVTPPYGLCLLISAAIGGIRVLDAIKEVGVLLVPMLGVLVLVIVFPDIVLFLPRLIMPQFVN